MNQWFCRAAFLVGAGVVAWIAAGFAGSSALGLLMTVLIAAAFGLGAWEIRRFRAATDGLARALAALTQPPEDLTVWLAELPASLRHGVRLRIEGLRAPLPGPALTPYLVGLLVMLGMLGTFLGMVVTFKGAVFALEGSTDLDAMRAALAGPIKGLGLSFGTSVAGVAASAALGLMSALSRRDRGELARTLDQHVATTLRPFSMAWQREKTFEALQAQTQALPDVVQRLGALMDGMERRSEQLDARLLAQQADFHREVGTAYTGLAQAVGQSLQESLQAGARAAGDSLRPVVESAMAGMADTAREQHQRVFDETRERLHSLTGSFEAATRAAVDGWREAQHGQASASQAQAERLERALDALAQTVERRTDGWLTASQQALDQAQARQANADAERLAAWSLALDRSSAALQDGWQRSGAQTLDGVGRLLAQSEALVQARAASESAWLGRQGELMDGVAATWRTELAALRDAEAGRAQAAVERLEGLQAALAQHLATLGAALEAPIARLVETASEAPQAAAELMVRLREEMGQLGERDRQALQERTALMERLSQLLQTLGSATEAQRGAIDGLMASATGTLEQAGTRFAAALDAQADQSREAAMQAASSAVELAALGDAFQHGVARFAATSEALMQGLQRIEGALAQSMARSDEQLAYYVAQAREIVDLSVSSQQGIVEDLHRLRQRPAALVEGSAG